MECWWEEPSSHVRIVHMHPCARSVSRGQVMAAGWDFADILNQLKGIIKYKDIY